MAVITSSLIFCRTLALVKPDAITKLGVIINCIRENNLQVCQAEMLHLRREDAAQFYDEYKGTTIYKYISTYKGCRLPKVFTPILICLIRNQELLIMKYSTPQTQDSSRV